MNCGVPYPDFNAFRKERDVVEAVSTPHHLIAASGWARADANAPAAGTRAGGAGASVAARVPVTAGDQLAVMVGFARVSAAASATSPDPRLGNNQVKAAQRLR